MEFILEPILALFYPILEWTLLLLVPIILFFVEIVWWTVLLVWAILAAIFHAQTPHRVEKPEFTGVRNSLDDWATRSKKKRKEKGIRRKKGSE